MADSQTSSMQKADDSDCPQADRSNSQNQSSSSDVQSCHTDFKSSDAVVVPEAMSNSSVAGDGHKEAIDKGAAVAAATTKKKLHGTKSESSAHGTGSVHWSSKYSDAVNAVESVVNNQLNRRRFASGLRDAGDDFNVTHSRRNSFADLPAYAPRSRHASDSMSVKSEPIDFAATLRADELVDFSASNPPVVITRPSKQRANEDEYRLRAISRASANSSRSRSNSGSVNQNSTWELKTPPPTAMADMKFNFDEELLSNAIDQLAIQRQLSD